MISIKDLAKECGVSMATVSKALNDHADVAEATKKRIRERAKELGYTPNSLARAIKTNRTKLIGILFVDEMHSGLTHEYFSNILESIKSSAESRGYDIAFINRNTMGSYLQHCYYRGFEGVIIASVDFEDPQVRELIDSPLPVVSIDHIFDKKTSILSDNLIGNRKLLEYVYNMGHRNIAFIMGDDTEVTRIREKSIRRFLDQYKLEIPDENFKRARFHDTQATYFAAKELLLLPNRPTCIFFPDDYSAIGGYNAINDSDLKIGVDISVVGYDGIGLSRIISPRLVTYHQNASSLGETAVLKLVEQIENPDNNKNDRIFISGELYDGASVVRIDK